MQTQSSRLCLLGVSAIILIGLSSPLRADPPARIARLDYLQGAVSFHPATVNDWAPAQLNYPLTTGDGLWIDSNSRAELHAGSTTIQLAPQTNSSILNLDDRTTQIQLTQGTLEMRIRSMRPGELNEVDTPNVAVSAARPGWYRIDVDPQGNTTVTSRDRGEAEMTAAGTAFAIYDNQTAHIIGMDAPKYDVQSAPPADGFDQWCISRYRREERPASLRYVSRELIGYEDLDPYGYWRNVGGYGPCWIPSHIAADWAPYRYGHWCWEEPWGWTWIDDQPWGFATCHYGRWIHAGNLGWGWAPGPLVLRPYYAPALVAFLGGGNKGASLVSGGGPIGWFPLGPGEIYRPPYQVTNVYIRNVNYEIRNFRPSMLSRENLRYINREIPGAVTVVPQRAFVSAASVNQSLVRLPQKELASARVLGTAAPLVPRRESVLAHPTGFLNLKSGATPPTAIQNRPVVVRHAPPPPKVQFTAQEKLLAQHPGRPPVPEALNSLRPHAAVPTPQVRMAVPQGPAPGMHPARPGIAPARPVPGAQVRNLPPGGTQRPGMTPMQRPMPSPQPGNQRTTVPPKQNAPGARQIKPPERLGRTQVPPPAASPPPARPQAAPQPRQNPPQQRSLQNPSPPRAQGPPPVNQRPAIAHPKPQPARPQAAAPAHPPRQSAPRAQPRAQPNPPQRPVENRPHPQPTPQRAAPRPPGPPPQQNSANPRKDHGK